MNLSPSLALDISISPDSYAPVSADEIEQNRRERKSQK